MYIFANHFCRKYKSQRENIMYKIFWGVFVCIMPLLEVYGQREDILIPTTDTIKIVEQSKTQQQPGLALAASKIFFSDKRWSVSGFGEYNYVPIQRNVNTNVGDLELYYSGLYRQSVFFGYKITDKLIWNSELQVEFLHYQNEKGHYEIIPETFLDYQFRDYLKFRIGFYPQNIGYVNNNDEPIMYYSVNRSEVERLIIPTSWNEMGIMFYGNISQNWNYALGLSQGLNSKNFISGSWIRQGREIQFDMPESISINPQINYLGIKNLALSISGYYGKLGHGNTVEINNIQTKINGKISLTSAYAKYDWNNFRFITLGTYGRLSDTEKIYELTKDDNGNNGQVLGKEVYGYLFEVGCDILPYLKKNKKEKPHRKNFLYDNHDMKLSLFARYERLNTHQGVHFALVHLPRTENDMDILTLGVNFNTKENIVLKANYQYRRNKSVFEPLPVSNIVETGIGFIF